MLLLQRYIKAKESEIKHYTLCLGNISKGFTINNMKKKTGLKGSVFFFFVVVVVVAFNLIDTNDVSDIHRYLMKGK